MDSKKNDAKINLEVDLGPLHLSNPATVASGTFGYGIEFSEFIDLDKIGAIFVKGLTVEPRSGHPQQRLSETPAGLLNCIGLQNVGIESFIRDKLPSLKQWNTKIIANISGATEEEYVYLTQQINQAEGIAALEVNISCPNIDAGGMAIGTNAVLTEKLTERIRQNTELPIIVKLTPNVTDIVTIAKAAWNGGADILSLINTLLGMAIDAETWKPVLSNVTGGLSGPAIKPVALRCVWAVSQNVPLPLIGMGGISTGTDAVEFMLAGASAISIGTANFINPDAANIIISQMSEYCFRHDISDIREITGRLHVNP
ncbi:dihydroorotate dehydrogenase [bacterium]|nr:dihydroorotate dehydrogenase [candidate division CSSED10-310 bacterium]